MNDFSEGLLNAIAGGTVGGSGAVGEMYDAERTNQMRVDTAKQLAEHQAQIQLEKQKALEEWKFAQEGKNLPETLRREGLMNQAKRDPLEERAKKLRLDEMEQSAKDKKEVKSLLKTRAGVAARFTGEGRTTALSDIDAKLAALGHSVKEQSMAEVEEKTIDPDTESSRTVKYKKPLSEVSAGGSKIVSTKAQYDALPSGSTYTGTDGKTYRKP